MAPAYPVSGVEIGILPQHAIPVVLARHHFPHIVSPDKNGRHPPIDSRIRQHKLQENWQALDDVETHRLLYKLRHVAFRTSTPTSE